SLADDTRHPSQNKARYPVLVLSTCQSTNAATDGSIQIARYSSTGTTRPMHHICYRCDRDFTTAVGLIQHYIQGNLHPYCRWCDDHFEDFEDLDDHYEDAHWYCDACDKCFRDDVGLHEHRRQTHADRYCVPCKRIFQNANNLRQYEKSSIHQGRTVLGPMKNCERAFPSTSTLVLHLESGTCTSGMTRKMVDDIIRKIDRSNVITNPNRMNDRRPDFLVSSGHGRVGD
ncbi:hypothetical protein C8Q74DRAFT_1388531, partial [Fomes fomentarius]